MSSPQNTIKKISSVESHLLGDSPTPTNSNLQETQDFKAFIGDLFGLTNLSFVPPNTHSTSNPNPNSSNPNPNASNPNRQTSKLVQFIHQIREKLNEEKKRELDNLISDLQNKRINQKEFLERLKQFQNFLLSRNQNVPPGRATIGASILSPNPNPSIGISSIPARMNPTPTPTLTNQTPGKVNTNSNPSSITVNPRTNPSPVSTTTTPARVSPNPNPSTGMSSIPARMNTMPTATLANQTPGKVNSNPNPSSIAVNPSPVSTTTTPARVSPNPNPSTGISSIPARVNPTPTAASTNPRGITSTQPPSRINSNSVPVQTITTTSVRTNPSATPSSVSAQNTSALTRINLTTSPRAQPKDTISIPASVLTTLTNPSSNSLSTKTTPAQITHSQIINSNNQLVKTQNTALESVVNRLNQAPAPKSTLPNQNPTQQIQNIQTPGCASITRSQKFVLRVHHFLTKDNLTVSCTYYLKLLQAATIYIKRILMQSYERQKLRVSSEQMSSSKHESIVKVTEVKQETPSNRLINSKEFQLAKKNPLYLLQTSEQFKYQKLHEEWTQFKALSGTKNLTQDQKERWNTVSQELQNLYAIAKAKFEALQKENELAKEEKNQKPKAKGKDTKKKKEDKEPAQEEPEKDLKNMILVRDALLHPALESLTLQKYLLKRKNDNALTFEANKKRKLA